MKKRNIVLIIFAAIIVIIVATVLIIQNSDYDCAEYTYSSDKLPKQFNGFRIAQISDLHNYRWQNLADTVAGYSPDIIVITGDLIGRKDKSLTDAVDTVRELCTIAPIYYIPGNHEAESDIYDELTDALASMNVEIFENNGTELERDGASIRLCGITDPFFKNKDEDMDDDLQDELNQSLTSAYTKEAISDYDGFTVLLAHRPEFIEIYAESGADLVFSGHAHGGAVCLPGGKPILAPGQGLFPKYTSGVHTVDGTSIVISRGLGDSTVPFRVNCPYEFVICTLETE